MAEKLGPFLALWKQVDGTLRAVNKKVQRALFWMRFAVAFLVFAVLGSWALAIGAIYYPERAPVMYLGAIFLLSIALMPWAYLASIPLKLKSVTRLVDKGYPANAKELALRAAARKLHDESIETEELLFDTAVNEGKKWVRKQKAEADARGDVDDLQPRP